jgi:hypothetical protein
LKAAILLGSVWFAFGSALIIIAAYPSLSSSSSRSFFCCVVLGTESSCAFCASSRTNQSLFVCKRAFPDVSQQFMN